MEFDLQPMLKGELIRLRPITPDDFDVLYRAASDPEIWKLHPESTRYQREVFQTYFDGALQSGGAFVIEDLKTGEIIGSSRYYDWNPELKEITIGYTFLIRAFWGGQVNRELKRLMLDHAFRFADCAVFEVGASNLRSRRAMEKIGARLDKELTLHGKPYVLYRIFR